MFDQVFDKRKSKVRGLWIREGVFYVQLRVTNPTSGKRYPTKVALGKDITTIPQAIDEMAALRRKESNGELNGSSKVPTFFEYFEYYKKHAGKDPKTMENEISFLKMWAEYFGEDTTLDKISEIGIRDFINKEKNKLSERTGRKLTNHSLNVRVYALRSMLRMAKSENKIDRIPFDGIKKLKHVAQTKSIPSHDEIETNVKAGIKHCPRSGKQFADYLHLLMYSGMRETEALSLKWDDIDFTKKTIHIHRNTKFGKQRYLDFNPSLEKLLIDMKSRRKEGATWLFPSPRPNTQGGHITNFKSTLHKVREKTGVYLSEHYLRHYFTSMCVMAGVDRIVLVKWLGHADGGKLIANVYGHLDNKFNQSQAVKLTNL